MPQHHGGKPREMQAGLFCFFLYSVSCSATLELHSLWQGLLQPVHGSTRKVNEDLKFSQELFDLCESTGYVNFERLLPFPVVPIDLKFCVVVALCSCTGLEARWTPDREVRLNGTLTMIWSGLLGSSGASPRGQSRAGARAEFNSPTLHLGG